MSDRMNVTRTPVDRCREVYHCSNGDTEAAYLRPPFWNEDAKRRQWRRDKFALERLCAARDRFVATASKAIAQHTAKQIRRLEERLGLTPTSRKLCR